MWAREDTGAPRWWHVVLPVVIVTLVGVFQLSYRDAGGWNPTTDRTADLAARMTALADSYPTGTVIGHFLREPHVRAEPGTA